MKEVLFETSLDLPLIHRGKVRDIYAVGEDHMLIVTSDRLSAFDVILPDPIPLSRTTCQIYRLRRCCRMHHNVQKWKGGPSS